jgi:type I restriction enzyme M protein
MDAQLEIFFSPGDSLLKKFEEIHDFVYSADGLSPQQALEEFVKILFIKVNDEGENLRLFRITDSECEKAKKGEIVESFLNRIAALFEQTKQAYPDVFEKDDRVKMSFPALAFTVEKLQELPLLDSSRDAKGLAFQKFLSHHEKDANGQFFTPAPVIDFCVAMMRPTPDEKIIDPACGSGGFLVSVLKSLRENYPDFDKQRVVSQNLFGFDINKSIARIAKMKLLLESGGRTNVFCANSLEGCDNPKSPDSDGGGYDLVLANPPFGAKVANAAVLKKFETGWKWIKTADVFQKTNSLQNSQATEVLFVEHCLNLLREGGRAGIVLPNGNFENPSLEYLRYYIKSRAKILAIVNLPQETFIPFGTGVKTSVLFLEKDSQNKAREYPVFFGRVTKLGYQGNKNGTPFYKKDGSGNLLTGAGGHPLLDEDFSEIAALYKKFKEGGKINGQNAFSISSNELGGRFDFDFCSPENRRIFAADDNPAKARLGDVCEIVKTKSPKLKNRNLTVEYIELSDINTHSYEIINSTTYAVHELPSRASYELCEGDIITAIAGNSVGTRKHAVALVTKEFAGCLCTNGFRVLRNFKIDPCYLLYFMKTDLFLRQMFMYRTGAAIPNVSDEDLSNAIIFLVGEKEQKIISEIMRKSFALREESRNQIKRIKSFEPNLAA